MSSATEVKMDDRVLPDLERAVRAISPDEGSMYDLKTSFPRSKIKVLLMESINQYAADYLRERGYSVEQAHVYTPEKLLEVIPEVYVIGVRSKTKLTEEVLRAAKKLMCVGCFCIGTDQTNLTVASELGIPVFNSPFANTRSVAELIISNIIGLSRKLGDQNRWMHEGKWRKTAKGCFEIRGKTLGIVGYGHVGSQVSVLAEAMGMSVIYYDIIPKLPLGNATASKSLESLLRQSDYVTLHVPFTPDTNRMIGAEQIAMMKQDSYLLNAARGKCVDIEAVAAALKSGHLAGAYFDVYPAEPTDETLPLIDCPNVILTPHIGGSTLEAQKAIAMEVSGKLAKFMDEGSTITSVNFPEVSLKPNPLAHRLLHVHRNVPGVLKKMMSILSDYNVSAQALQTTKDIGYMLVEMDSDRQLSNKVKRLLDAMDETINCRVLFSPGAI